MSADAPAGERAGEPPLLRVRRLAWRNVFDLRHEQLDRLLADEKERKRIEDRVLPLAVDRRAKIRGAYWKLLVAVIVMHAALYASVFDQDLEINVVGIAIKRIAGVREWLVLVGALLSTVTLMLAAYDALLASFIKRCLRIVFGAELGAMLEPVYVESSAGLAVQLPVVDRLEPHPASFAMLVSAGVATVALALLVLGLSTVMYAQILIDVVMRSKLSTWLVVLVVGTAGVTTLIGLGALAVAIATPYHDYAGLAELQRLETEDPEAWRRQARLNVEHDGRRIDARATILGVALMLAALAIGATLRPAAWPAGAPLIAAVAVLGLVVAYGFGARGRPALRRWEARRSADPAPVDSAAASRFARRIRGLFLLAQIALAAVAFFAVWRA